jgi:hypothetical protein
MDQKDVVEKKKQNIYMHWALSFPESKKKKEKEKSWTHLDSHK